VRGFTPHFKHEHEHHSIEHENDSYPTSKKTIEDNRSTSFCPPDTRGFPLASRRRNQNWKLPEGKAKRPHRLPSGSPGRRQQLKATERQSRYINRCQANLDRINDRGLSFYIHYQLPTAHLFLPTDDCQLPTSSYFCQLPTANCQLPTSSYFCQLMARFESKSIRFQPPPPIPAELERIASQAHNRLGSAKAPTWCPLP
jgi:hypothetical protein